MLALRGNIFVLVDRYDSNSRTVNSGSRDPGNLVAIETTWK